MLKTTVYVADDGHEFKDETSCRIYEKQCRMQGRLTDLLTSACNEFGISIRDDEVAEMCMHITTNNLLDVLEGK